MVPGRTDHRPLLVQAMVPEPRNPSRDGVRGFGARRPASRWRPRCPSPGPSPFVPHGEGSTSVPLRRTFGCVRQRPLRSLRLAPPPKNLGEVSVAAGSMLGERHHAAPARCPSPGPSPFVPHGEGSTSIPFPTSPKRTSAFRTTPPPKLGEGSPAVARNERKAWRGRGPPRVAPAPDPTAEASYPAPPPNPEPPSCPAAAP